MASMVIRDANEYGPLSEDRLAAFESQLGHRLPDDYREFVLIYNGGVPDPAGFHHPPFERDRVTNLFGIYGPGDAPPVVPRLSPHIGLYSEYVPDRMLTIGYGECNTALCISVLGSDRGAIYLVPPWDLMEEEPEDNAHRLADSFTAFLESLVPVPPEPPHIPTALQTICAEGDVAALLKLVEAKGPDLRDEEGYGALGLSITAHQLVLVKLLVEHGADTKRMISLAAYHGAVEIVAYALSTGVDIEMRDPNFAVGATPLIVATMQGHAQVVSLLIAKGADVNAKNRAGITAHQWAWRNGHKDIMQMLVKAGAEPRTG